MELAAAAGVTALVVVGESDPAVTVPAGVPVVSLVDSVGRGPGDSPKLPSSSEDVVRDYLR